jgi:hypothetical protein
LAAEHDELVAKDQDLEVVRGVAAGEQHEELDGAAQSQVGELRQHQGDLGDGGGGATVPRRDIETPQLSGLWPCFCTLRAPAVALAAVTATSALSLGLRVTLLRRPPARDLG